ncbi:hypothetical protein GCM10022244_13690 [Streptomyces gulbargensis]|uniref:Uncharacterized protein n=1 Tax=Streptomyces gulbargensis TaxID=364901 RepID=A0ABP7LMD3_9ACTN
MSLPRAAVGRRGAGGGFTSQGSAEEALRRFPQGEAGGSEPDRRRLPEAWLAAKTLVPKPTKTARYRDFVRDDPTTTARDARKAALSSMRERPPTCSKQSRDDRI